MSTVDELRASLLRIEGRSYKAYRDVLGGQRWDFADFALFVDHVQADPFAAPSKLRVRVPAETAQIPPALFASDTRRVALADFLAREVRRQIRQNGPPGSPGQRSTRPGKRYRDGR